MKLLRSPLRSQHRKRLQIINIIDKAAPALTGIYDAYDAGVVIGDYAYLADGNSAFKIIDVSDETNPINLASVSSIDAKAITGFDSFIFASQYGRIYALNIIDPALPVELEYMSNALNGEGMCVSGGYIYRPQGTDIEVLTIFIFD